MKDKEKREKVYFTWMVLRCLKSPVKMLIRIFNQHKLEVLIFAGEKDNVIPLQPLKKFARKSKNCRLILLPVNHHKLIDSAGAWIRDRPGLL